MQISKPGTLISVFNDGTTYHTPYTVGTRGSNQIVSTGKFFSFWSAFCMILYFDTLVTSKLIIMLGKKKANS